MGDVVNLNRARKVRAGAAKRAKAAENRAVHGRTKNQKGKEQLEADQMRDKLDAHKRERPPEED